MITLRETRNKIENDIRWWPIHLMNFVDDFRRHKKLAAIEEAFEPGDRQMDSWSRLRLNHFATSRD